MTDDFTKAARAEAESWIGMDLDDHVNFVSGAEWARDHLASQEPTDAECVAVLDVRYGAPLGPHDEPYDAEELAGARAALSAARNARRDEEKR